jgi:hypothetical protein
VGGHSAGEHLISLLALDKQYIRGASLQAEVIKDVAAIAIAIRVLDDQSNPNDHID